MSIINHTLIKYMFFHTYYDLLPLILVYSVLENDNFILENNIFLAVGITYIVLVHCKYYCCYSLCYY